MRGSILLVVSVTLVDPCVSLSCWVYFHLGLNAMFASPILTDLHRVGGKMIFSTRSFTETETYMEVVVVEQLPSVFVPDYCRPGLSLGNAEKHDLVAQHVLVVEVRGLGNLSSLTRHHLIISRQILIVQRTQ